MTTAMAMPVSVSTIGTMTWAYLDAAEMGEKVGVGLVVVELEIDLLAIHALHGAHAVDAFGERAVGDRVGLVRRHERLRGRAAATRGAR